MAQVSSPTSSSRVEWEYESVSPDTITKVSKPFKTVKDLSVKDSIPCDGPHKLEFKSLIEVQLDVEFCRGLTEKKLTLIFSKNPFGSRSLIVRINGILASFISCKCKMKHKLEFTIRQNETPKKIPKDDPEDVEDLVFDTRSKRVYSENVGSTKLPSEPLSANDDPRYLIDESKTPEPQQPSDTANPSHPPEENRYSIVKIDEPEDSEPQQPSDRVGWSSRFVIPKGQRRLYDSVLNPAQESALQADSRPEPSSSQEPLSAPPDLSNSFAAEPDTHSAVKTPKEIKEPEVPEPGQELSKPFFVIPKGHRRFDDSIFKPAQESTTGLGSEPEAAPAKPAKKQAKRNAPKKSKPLSATVPKKSSKMPAQPHSALPTIPKAHKRSKKPPKPPQSALPTVTTPKTPKTPTRFATLPTTPSATHEELPETPTQPHSAQTALRTPKTPKQAPKPLKQWVGPTSASFRRNQAKVPAERRAKSAEPKITVPGKKRGDTDLSARRRTIGEARKKASLKRDEERQAQRIHEQEARAKKLAIMQGNIPPQGSIAIRERRNKEPLAVQTAKTPKKPKLPSHPSSNDVHNVKQV